MGMFTQPHPGQSPDSDRDRNLSESSMRLIHDANHIIATMIDNPRRYVHHFNQMLSQAIARCTNESEIDTILPRLLDFSERSLAVILSPHSNYRSRDFLSAPPESPLDKLDAFVVLGLDFKINPSGELKIIEINGLKSGMKGYALSNTKVSEDGGEWRADRAANAYFNKLGGRHAAMLGTSLCVAGMPQWRLPIVVDLATDRIKELAGIPNRGLWQKIAPEWNRVALIGQGLAKKEELLENKKRMDQLLGNQWRNFKPESFECTEEQLAQLCAQYAPEFIVIKPKLGSQGNDVQIVPSGEAIKAVQALSHRAPDYIAEPFIPSIPIHSSKTHRLHDGCMRYVCIVEKQSGGDIVVRHFGGYWRLSPKPITEYGALDAMRANLAQEGIPEQLSESDLEIARPVADELARWLITHLPSA